MADVICSCSKFKGNTYIHFIIKNIFSQGEFRILNIYHGRLAYLVYSTLVSKHSLLKYEYSAIICIGQSLIVSVKTNEYQLIKDHPEDLNSSFFLI